MPLITGGSRSWLFMLSSFCGALAFAVTLSSVPCQALDNEGKLSAIEQMLIGHSNQGEDFNKRLAAVETQIYGKPKHGGEDKRIQNLVDLIGIKDTAEVKNELNSAPAGGLKPEAGNSLSTLSAPDSAGSAAQSAVRAAEQPTTSPSRGASTPVDAVSNPSSPHSASRSASPVLVPGRVLRPHERALLEKVGKVSPESRKRAAGPTHKNQPAVSHESSPKGKSEATLKALTPAMAMPPVAPARSAVRAAASGGGVSVAPSRIPAHTTRANPKKSTSRLATVSEIRSLLERGVKLNAGGQTSQAAQTFRNVLTLDPHNVDAFYNLGSMAEAQGDLVTALTNYRAAQQFNPDDRDLKAAIASVESQLAKSTEVNTPPVFSKGTVGGSAETPLKDNASYFHAGNEPPVIDASTENQKVFQLSSQQMQLLGTANGAQSPVLGVSQANPPSLVGVSQPVQKPKRGKFGAILSVGAGVALQGTPFHCPVCALLRGL